MSFTESLEQLVYENRNGLLGKHPAWERVQLRDVASVLNGFAFSSSYFTKDEGKPLLRIRDILEDHTETKYSGEFDPVYVVTAGDLLIGMDGDFNCALWRGPEALLNQRVCKLTVREALHNKKLMAFALPGYLKAINDATSSITVKHLSSRTVEEIPLPLPPRLEQDRIVAEIEKQFTRLDDAVVALKRVRANLKRYRASVLKAACEGRLVPAEAELARKEGRNYESASELLKRILAERRAKWEAEQLQKMVAAGKPPTNDEWKRAYMQPAEPNRSALPELPDGWEWASLEQLLREPLRNGHSAKKSQTGEGVRTLTLTAVTEGDFSEENIKITTAVPDKVRDLWLGPGDIFVERSNTPELVGISRLFTGPSKFAIFPDLLIRVRVSALLDAKFIETVLLSDRVRIYFRRSAQGISGSMPKIDQTTIEKAAVPLPPRTEQARITEEVQRQLSQIDAAHRTIALRLRTAQQLRQAVLRKAFSGKLVPQNPNDEPASVLLERIRAERARAQEQKEKTPKATNGASSGTGQRRRHHRTVTQSVRAGKG